MQLRNAKSPREKFLASIAPPFKIPRCPYGNYHAPRICMGSKNPRDIGRCSYMCVTRNGQPQCIKSRLTMVPEHPPEVQADLSKRLTAWDRQKAAQKAFDRLQEVDQVVKSLTPAVGLVAEPSDRLEIDVAKETHVLIRVYMSANEEYFEHHGLLINSSYALLEDRSLCNLVDFPNTRYSVFDSFQDQFNSIPTFGRLDIQPDEYLILRPSVFQDNDCPELRRLIINLRAILMRGERYLSLLSTRPLDNPALPLTPLTTPSHSPVRYGKRRAVDSDVEDEFLEGCSSQPMGRVKRARISLGFIDLT
ncbi:hypothetical protein FPV67DRAFT_584680 [Lyophyllum atratum]|nr:hypothetical protein FPV67DRAFT_584680 [Lyophyllum atratum]